MPRAILTYHSIDESDSVVSTPSATFERQVEHLAAAGISTIDPLGILEAPEEQKTVALTFDDGFANFYAKAFPALARHGFSATVLLVAGRCGESADWAEQPAALLDRELLTWSKIQELQRAGIRFGAHGMTHQALPSLTNDEAQSEILDSKHLIEDQTGEPVECFAYPYGRSSPMIREIVAQNFGAGLSTEMGFITNVSHHEALERIDVYYLKPSIWFEGLFEPHGRAYVACRAAARTLKQQLTPRAVVR